LELVLLICLGRIIETARRPERTNTREAVSPNSGSCFGNRTRRQVGDADRAARSREKRDREGDASTVSGATIAALPYRRDANWSPAGPGFTRVSVVDAAGGSASAPVRID
jgi:hypothetical protein